jgi:hypothetical protein
MRFCDDLDGGSEAGGAGISWTSRAMKRINIYANGSPIHSRVIEFLLTRHQDEQNIVINYRGMRFHTDQPVGQFYCAAEELLNERDHVKQFVDSLGDLSDARVHLFVAHSNYLLCKLHAARRMGPISYIEDGIGTYAALVDDALGTDFFDSAMSVDVTRTRPKTWRESLLAGLPPGIGRLVLAVANCTWNRNRALAIDLFTIALRKHDVFFDFSSPAYRHIYLTIPKFPGRSCVPVPLTIATPIRTSSAKLLVLIPPKTIIGESCFAAFAEAMLRLAHARPSCRFDYKSHPSDTAHADYHLLMRHDALQGDMITVESNNETAIVAYELGYGGLVCFDSSATLYATAFLSERGFDCIDLCLEMTGREPYGVRLSTQLAKM